MFFTSVAVMSRVSRKMWLALLVCQLSLLGARGQIPAECVTSDTNRPPENSDIMVYCGTEHMDLSVFLCPVYQALYNESLMVLNNELNNAECFGEADFAVDPPVLKFSFPINESATSSCGNDFNIINQVGTGAFADFSNVQYVNISGTVNSIDPSASMITYRPQLIYMFSCLYPMQYIINNTELGVAGVNVAIKDNNGSFISTLSLELYEDDQFQNALTMPTTGLQLKTKIYVAVRATNLTDRFNVLLDRCYATTSPYPAFDSFYDLFIGCTRDDQTEVILNGESQVAHFSFEAFRFVEHKNRTVSTFYLHCVTRLCEVSACEALKPVCSVGRRKRREVEDVLGNATVTSPPIMVAKKSRDFQTNTASYGVSRRPYSDLVVAVIIHIIILSHFRF